MANTRLLLIEDNPIAAKAAQHILSSLSYTVDVAVEASEAIHLTHQEDYALIFMDIGLPDTDGYELTQYLRSHLPSPKNAVPILALSAYDDLTQQNQCHAAGMTATLVKPLTKAKAEEALLRYLVSDVELAVIDFATIHKFISNDPKVYLPLLQTFLTSLPVQAAQVSQAMLDQQWAEVTVKAHKLNGGARYCGALQLSAICDELQHLHGAPDAFTQTRLQEQWHAIVARLLKFEM